MLPCWTGAFALIGSIAVKPSQAASDSAGEHDVRLYSNAPIGSSKVIDHAFAGVAMKGFSWPEFTNTFSQNLYNALARRTGTDVIIRLGGTAMDHISVNLNQTKAITFPNGKNNGLRSNSILGTEWFDTFEKLDNVSFIVQFGLAINQGHNYADAVEYVKNAIHHLGGCNSTKLQAVELGNEPNLYVRQHARPQTYGVDDYVDEAKVFMDILEGNITCLRDSKKFQVYQRSSTTSDPSWSIDAFMKKALKSLDLRKRVKTVSQHFYANQDSPNLQATLLNHSFTKSRTDTFFKPGVHLVEETHRDLGVDFIIDEVGNADIDGTDEQKRIMSMSLASAVWTVDWMLYAMSTNITRVNMQQGTHMDFAHWTPSGIQAGWYGHVMVADFIGNNTNNALRVKELKHLAHDVGDPHLAGYAGYEHGKLAKLAFVNLRSWDGEKEGHRPVTKLNLRLPFVKDGTKVTTRRLTGPSTESLQNVTWAGLDWPKSQQGKEVKVKNDTEEHTVSCGSTKVAIGATEAILVTW